MFALTILTLRVLPALSQDAHDHDAHEDEHADGHAGDAFEWAGIFDTPENTYLWTAQKVQSGTAVDYADATMKMAVIPASSATEATLHSLESEGNHGLEMICIDVSSGDVIIPMADRCYRLLFRPDWWQSLYTIDATGHDAVAFFTEHFPTEFENTAHYLKDDHGDDIEPVGELPEVIHASTNEMDADDKKPWGAAIGVSIIVNLVTLMGVIFLVPALSKAAQDYAGEFECVTSGFAAGAISACAFFLLLFESTHLISDDHAEEVDQIWRWGTMILAGATFPSVLHLILEFILKKPDDETETEEKVSQAAGARIISGILLGDFVHNLCDGFFIGAAFAGCGTTFGWTVAWGTVAHEIAQEISDYVVLTGKDCKLRPPVALGLNFLSGTGVLLGTIIVLSTDVGNGDIGLLLAFGGGVYLYIAFVECMPKLMSAKVSVLVRLLGIFVFMLGATAIGLVLLDHEHCVPPSPDGAEPAPGGHHHL